jgi:type IV secretory pathway VirB2 component (pilin)
MNLNKKIATIVLVSLLVPVFAVLAGPTAPPNVDPWVAIQRITDFIFGLLLALAVFFIIIAGFMFVTASGNDEQVKKARGMLLYAVVGVIVALLSKGIVTFLQSTFS